MNTGQGKSAGVASKPMAIKNNTVKPNGDGSPAKSLASASSKPAAKAAPASPPKKPAGDGTTAKQAAVKPSSTSAPVSPKNPISSKTPKSTAASTSGAEPQPCSPPAVAAGGEKTVESDGNVPVTSKPAKRAPVLARATADPSTAPAAAKPAVPETPTAPGDPVITAVNPKPATAAVECPDVKATSSGSGSSSAAPADNHVTKDPRVVIPAGDAAAAAAIAADGSEAMLSKRPSLVAGPAPVPPPAADTATAAAGPRSQAAGPPLRSGSSSAAASAVAPEPAPRPTSTITTSSSDVAADSPNTSTAEHEPAAPQTTTTTAIITTTAERSASGATTTAALAAAAAAAASVPQAASEPMTTSAPVPSASALDAASTADPVLNRPLPIPVEKAASVRAISPVSQIASEPAIDCITVKPAATQPPVKGAPSLKVISAPPPLRTASMGAVLAFDGTADAENSAGTEPADTAATKPGASKAPALPPRSRTGSTAWEAPPIAAGADDVAAVPAASAPVVLFEASVSTRSLLPQDLEREAEAVAATSPQQPSTTTTPQSMPAPSVETATAGAAALAAASSAPAGCVVITLEHNPSGPCPVELSWPALDPAGSGEGVAWTCTADLMTAAMKALRAKYGAVQASPAVNAFFVEPAVGSGAAGALERRRWLSTFDALPQELLAAASSGGRANVILQGITCGEAVEPQAAGAATRTPAVSTMFPLPGFAESVESVGVGAPPSRVTFLSEAGSSRASPNPPTRGLLRGGSRGGSNGGGTAAAGPAGGRILGAGHRSVRIRLEENTVETLCVESACPSPSSLRSQVHGTRLPPLRNDSDRSRADDETTGPSPFRGRLGVTRSSRRLIVPACDLIAESVASSECDNSVRSPMAMDATAAAVVKRDPVQVLKQTNSLGAEFEANVVTTAAVTTTARDARGGEEGENGGGEIGAGAAAGTRSSPGRAAASSVVTAKRRSSSTGMEGAPPAAAGAVASSMGRRSSLVVRSEADTGSGEDLEAAFFPAPAAEWIDLMGAETTDSQAPSQPGGCLSCFSTGSKAAQQQQWRERLQEALKARDEAEVAAWVTFHCGRSGTRNQRELDAMLWLAVEARAPGLVKVLIRGGANPDAPRPMGLMADAAPTRGSLGSPSVARPMPSARVKDSAVVSAPLPPPPAMAWWPGSAATATAALEGLTPLMRAAELASYDVVEVLLAGGANAIVVHPTTGWTAVHRAVLATSPSTTAWGGRRLFPAMAVGVGSNSSSGSAVTAAAGKVGVRGVTSAAAEKGGGGGGGDDAAASALHCLRLLVQRIGLQHAAVLTTAGRYSDDLVRFAVRHGRSEALSWLLSTGLSPDGGASSADDDDDEASCAFLAGRLGLTVEVWDTPPPPRQGALRDRARPLSWLISPEERLFTERRRQLLMGAAAGGRVDVLAAVLDKPPPLDRLRRDELEAAIGACRLAQPRNQRQVEELLTRKAHTYMSWERETLPALRRFDEPVIREWLVCDRPMPVEVDRALAALLSSERLGAPLWHDNAAAAVQVLLDGGADIEHEWDVDTAQLPHLMSGREIKTLRPLQAALLAPAPAIARQLLAAGADPRRRDAKGENALFFSIRTAVAASIIAHECNDPDVIRMVRQQPSGISCANSSGRSGAAAAAASEVTSSECIDVLLATEHAAELLAARNDDGLTPAVLAALADTKGILEKLCAAGADPWATPVAAAPGAPPVPSELVSSGNRRSASENSSLWSVGHEAARLGALSTLELLLGGPSSTVGRKAPLTAANAEQAAVRRRDALVGAIRGGRVGAAKLALDAGGFSGSLYEAELAAALALCKASAVQKLPAAADIAAATGGPHGPDAPRYEALAAFLASRAHVYMNWEGEVLPAIRSGSVSVVRRWIAYDKISAATATRALCALVDAAQQCTSSAASVETTAGAAAASTAAATTALDGDAVAAGVLSRLYSVGASCLTSPGKAVADVAAELVKAGADVNFQQEPSAGGQSLLMQVAVIGHLPLLEALLALGARVDAEDAAGMTAVDHAVLARARLADNGCLAALLAAYGARRINAHRNHAGDSALMLAVRAGDSTAVQLLMASGATPAAADASAPARTGSMSGAVAASAAPAAGSISASDVGAVSRTHRISPSASDDPPGVSTAALVTTASAAAAIGSDARPSSDVSTTAPSELAALNGRSLDTFTSGLTRRGSALYLAARMDDKMMLQQLLRKASCNDDDLASCRQEVQLGALHGGRVALLEASLAVPELLKSVPGPAEGGGATALGGAATVCARLSEQAAVRLAEAQGLVVELQAVAADASAAAGDAGAAGAVPISVADVTRLQRYLTAKASALEALKGAHSRMGEFYALAKLHMEALEGALEAKKELVSNSIRDSSDAQVKLMAATTRLTASKDSVLRSVLARRDAQLGRVEGLLEKKLAGLAAAQRRAEAKVTSDVEGIIMDMRKLVGRKLKDIDAKKLQAFGHLGALERKLDVVWGRRQRLLAGRPPAVRVALNQKMGALMQQLGTRREALNEAVSAAIAKMEGGQRRGTALVNMEALRAALAREQQDMARGACEAAAIAKAAIVQRAEELLRIDKHDQLLRIVGHMQAEVTRGSSSTAAASAKALAALQQAYAVAVGDLERRVAQARARMQEHLTELMASHVDLVKTLTLADDASQAEAATEALAALPDAQLNPSGTPPDVAMLLLKFEGAAALDGVQHAGLNGGSGGENGTSAQESTLSVLQRVATVEETIEDMIQDMAAEVLHAFPADGICDTLAPLDLAPLLEPDSEISTAGLGIDRLRQDIAAIDFGLPNLDLEVGDLDLSALEDDVGGQGGMRAFGVGAAAMGMGLGAYDNYDEDDVGDDVGAAPQGRYGNGGGVGGVIRNRRSSDEGDAEPGGGRGRYHAADYGDRHEDDFALSYS
ncbi:hypothetical protein VaNZ11_016749 [Volvox africanus]|uniref:Uncharacterized protein n=1 Tax=Volvox africanus TaxID=51714 RepID=A0ABQ5SNE0_9CHLO|nr:hypothetical protein VaNZ11_016749 [Volvox africanus]